MIMEGSHVKLVGGSCIKLLSIQTKLVVAKGRRMLWIFPQNQIGMAYSKYKTYSICLHNITFSTLRDECGINDVIFRFNIGDYERKYYNRFPPLGCENVGKPFSLDQTINMHVT